MRRSRNKKEGAALSCSLFTFFCLHLHHFPLAGLLHDTGQGGFQKFLHGGKAAGGHKLAYLLVKLIRQVNHKAIGLCAAGVAFLGPVLHGDKAGAGAEGGDKMGFRLRRETGGVFLWVIDHGLSGLAVTGEFLMQSRDHVGVVNAYAGAV